MASRAGLLGRLGARLTAVSDGVGDRRYGDRDSRSRPASRGRGWIVLSTVLAFACWLVWLAFDLIELGSPGEPLRGLPFAAVVALAVYWLTRLAGHLVRVTWDRGPRRSTLIPNLVTAIFIVLCGVAFLSRTPLALEPLWEDLWRSF